MRQDRREDHVAHPGERESFAIAEAAAREILRQRGLTDEQIESELSRSHREETE